MEDDRITEVYPVTEVNCTRIIERERRDKFGGCDVLESLLNDGWEYQIVQKEKIVYLRKHLSGQKNIDKKWIKELYRGEEWL